MQLGAFFSIRRSVNGRMKIPSRVNPSPNSLAIYAATPTPRGQRHGFAVDGKQLRRSSIVSGLARKEPTAILRAEIRIYVQSRESMLRRRLVPHVIAECLERQSPARAHLDADGTGCTVLRILRIVTTASHVKVSIAAWITGIHGRREFHRTKNCLYRQSARRSIANAFVWTADRPGPVRNGFCFPVVCQTHIIQFIVSLLNSSCPPNISRLITLGGIDSIDRMKRAWSRSYVLDESVKRIVPFVANSDASCTVVFVRRVTWFAATVANCDPCAILRGIILVRLIVSHDTTPIRVVVRVIRASNRADRSFNVPHIAV